MQILGLLGMYFDAVVVEVKTFFTFIQIGSGHTVLAQYYYHLRMTMLLCLHLPFPILGHGDHTKRALSGHCSGFRSEKQKKRVCLKLGEL